MGKEGKSKGPRAKNAYMFFCADKRQEVIDNNPNIKPKEIMSELGRLWKDLTDSDKEKYNKLAEEDKKRVAAEKEKNPGSSEKKTKSKKAKKSKSDSDDDGDGDNDNEDENENEDEDEE